MKACAFGERGGRGRDGWAKARLEMGAGERDEQHGRDRLDAVRARVVVAYCTRVVLDSVKWLPKVCQWCVLTEYVTVRVG